MSQPIQLKRRNVGTGAPSTLLTAEPAYNATEDVLYIGKGDNGSGGAQSIVPVAGRGYFAPLTDANLLGTPTVPTASPNDSSTKAANTQFVTSAVQAVQAGFQFKDPVRVATTASIAHSGLLTVDGVTLVAGDRVLDKDNVDPTLRGIWIAAGGTWARSTDADASAEVKPGMFLIVTEGTVNGDTVWLLTTNAPITVGSTALTFAQFGAGGGTISAGPGVQITGGSIEVRGFNAAASGALFKKSGTDFVAAVAGTDYALPTAAIDGGTF